MQFVSTRKNKEPISFSQAISRCICPDGGYYVPAYSENLRQWIYYLNDKTSFSSIAGSPYSMWVRGSAASPRLCPTRNRTMEMKADSMTGHQNSQPQPGVTMAA